MENNTLRFVALVNEIEAFIERVLPESKRVSKYGGTLFTLKPEEKEGQFCGVFIYKQHVQLSFSKGVQLKDPKKLLEGSGTLRRHINLRSVGDIDFKYLETLLIQSSNL